MQLGAVKHRGHRATGKEMIRLIETYSKDIGSLSNWPIDSFFDYVKKISYKQDPDIFKDNSEILARPKYLLNPKYYSSLDCKKKSILICSWCKENKIPFRLLAVSEKPSKVIHHVFPQGFFITKWVNLDATYPDHYLGQGRKITYGEILK